MDLLLKRGRCVDAFTLQIQLEVISKLRNDLQDKAASLGLQSLHFAEGSSICVQLQYGRFGQGRTRCCGKDKDVLLSQITDSTACNGECLSDEHAELKEARAQLNKILFSLKRLSIQCFLIVALDACGYPARLDMAQQC